MSDALNYLLKVRPEAMNAYFDFIKQSASHLDKKTRALISVITKVDNQTETGFKQYLSRALQAGASPNEIIDALLVAFPTLGLSKIIWAMDIIVKMDIPGFRPENLEQSTKWHEVGSSGDIPEGVTRKTCDGRELFIYRRGNTFKVYDSHCPHQVTNIPELGLSGNTLTCPKHQWKFDITTGNCIENGDRPLKQYESRVVNGLIEVNW